MRRVKEEFLPRLQSLIPLEGKSVLEIGCGIGTRSEEIAALCSKLTALEPDGDKLHQARARHIPNAVFVEGTAAALPFRNDQFDMVIFTLSFHHVPVEQMGAALHESARVAKGRGFVVFLEPGTDGSFFEAEIRFDACDGDEREAKRAAYQAMMKSRELALLSQFYDETVFQFDSLEDFVSTLGPKQNLDELPGFLAEYDFELRAQRRINVFQVFHI